MISEEIRRINKEMTSLINLPCNSSFVLEEVGRNWKKSVFSVKCFAQLSYQLFKKDVAELVLYITSG